MVLAPCSGVPAACLTNNDAEATLLSNHLDKKCLEDGGQFLERRDANPPGSDELDDDHAGAQGASAACPLVVIGMRRRDLVAGAKRV